MGYEKVHALVLVYKMMLKMWKQLPSLCHTNIYRQTWKQKDADSCTVHRCLLLPSNRKLSACVYVCTAVLGVLVLLLNKPIMSEGELFVVGFWSSFLSGRPASRGAGRGPDSTVLLACAG